MAVKKYTPDDLEHAVAEIQAGEALSMCAVTNKYGVPHSTLHDHLRGKSKKAGAGAPTVLTTSEEREIALTRKTLADMGFGLTRELVQVVIYDYLQDKTFKILSLGVCQGKIGGSAL